MKKVLLLLLLIILILRQQYALEREAQAIRAQKQGFDCVQSKVVLLCLIALKIPVYPYIHNIE